MKRTEVWSGQLWILAEGDERQSHPGRKDIRAGFSEKMISKMGPFQYQMLLLSSEMNSDYLPIKHPLINIEANVFLWTIFFFSTILDCFSAAGWHMPRQFQLFQQIAFQMFHQPQQNKGLPHRWASFFFPSSPPPRLYNTNWCHQGIYLPSGRYRLVLMSRQVAGFTGRLQRELKWQDSSHTPAPRTGSGIQQKPWGAVVALGVAPPKAGKLHAPP